MGECTTLSASTPSPPGHLRARQRMRARIALLAHEEADHADTLAVRVPGRPGVAPLVDIHAVSVLEPRRHPPVA